MSHCGRMFVQSHKKTDKKCTPKCSLVFACVILDSRARVLVSVHSPTEQMLKGLIVWAGGE